MEKWVDIDSYDGLYQISNLGRVKSFNGRWIKESIITNSINCNGYFRVNLKKCNVQKEFLVHRLLAKYFISNPTNLPHVNHKNGDRLDNRIENLEWVSNRENSTHRHINSVASSKYTGVCWNKASKKWQANIREDGKPSKYLGRFDSEEDASMAYRVTLGSLGLENKYAVFAN